MLKEHKAAKWLIAETLDSVDWLPADQGLIEGIREYLRNLNVVSAKRYFGNFLSKYLLESCLHKSILLISGGHQCGLSENQKRISQRK